MKKIEQKETPKVTFDKVELTFMGQILGSLTWKTEQVRENAMANQILQKIAALVQEKKDG